MTYRFGLAHANKRKSYSSQVTSPFPLSHSSVTFFHYDVGSPYKLIFLRHLARNKCSSGIAFGKKARAQHFVKCTLSSQEVRILSFHLAATCKWLQVAARASGCQVTASDCYFCPENIMISPHAALEKTKISAMLFCEEIPVLSRAAKKS